MRNTRPNLWTAYMIYAVWSIALGFNFLFLTPTFIPLDIPKWIVGLAFLSCGTIKLTLLLMQPNYTLLRLSMAMSVAIYSFWAGILTFEFLHLSQTSMQLPVMYIGSAAVGVWLLRQPLTSLVIMKAEE